MGEMEAVCRSFFSAKFKVAKWNFREVVNSDTKNRVCWGPLQTRKDTRGSCITVHLVTRHRSA